MDARALVVLLVLCTAGLATGQLFPPPCDSDIYCDGQLLHTVQMAHLHNDSKHFVDMPMRHDPSLVRENFRQLMSRSNQKPSVDAVRSFVEENFAEPGSEFDEWHPTDWKPDPGFLSRVRDADLREWMSDLHSAWKQLGRQVSAEVYLHPERYSLVYVPNPTIVPGGRFREFYYWDSYWVLKGLLLSEMTETVRGMLENFLSMVKKYGMVPNGGRVYFSRRSQPPFLLPMVQLYMEATDDVEFLSMNMPLLEKEYEFWRTNRSVEVTKDGRTFTMYRYNAQIGRPRPESYREDLELAEQLSDSENAREMFQSQLKSGAESGWDFSSRWYILGASQVGPGTLKDLKTRSIVPVDLNSLMLWNARLLSAFSERLGLTSKAAMYRKQADELLANINQLLWDEESGSWYDWDNKNNKLMKKFYPSNIFPIWVGASTTEQNSKFLRYLINSNATSYLSGIPTSLENSGQQWDFPNAWPPLQHVVVESLNRMDSEEAKQLAFDEVKKWMDTNYISYMESQPHAMFEKYDVTRVGLPGGGGEYDVQLGFGWTNGVVMAFADEYGDKLVAPPLSAGAVNPPGRWIIALLVPVTLLVAVGNLLWRRAAPVTVLGWFSAGKSKPAATEGEYRLINSTRQLADESSDDEHVLYASQQLLQPSQQLPQPSQQLPQPLQQLPQPLQQLSQSHQQLSQPLQQLPQSSQQLPQPSQQLSQPLQQLSQPSQQLSQPSQQPLQSSQQLQQPSQQLPQPSELQLPQTSQLQLPQTSQLQPQLSETQLSQPSELLSHSAQQLSQPFELQLSQQQNVDIGYIPVDSGGSS